MLDIASILRSWSLRDFPSLQDHAKALIDADRKADAATLMGLIASLRGDFTDALDHYKTVPEEPFLRTLRSVDHRYCSTKAKRVASRTSVGDEIAQSIRIFRQFSGDARRQLLHHQIYTWYISAFWFQQSQSFIASIWILMLTCLTGNREGLIHGVFMLGHLLNVCGVGILGLPLVEWAFRRSAEIRPWQQPAFLSYMAYGIYMTGRRSDLAEDVLRQANRTLRQYPDPFYRILFVVSQLRSASQQGDIVTAEAMAEELITHSDQVGIKRFYYAALADLALCYGIRGLYWRADEQLKMLAAYKPDGKDPVESGSIYRLKGWAEYYCGRYQNALSDAELALTSFKKAGSFRLARQMASLLMIISKFRVNLESEAPGYGIWETFRMQIHVLRLLLLKFAWGSNIHVKRTIEEELSLLKRGIQRIGTTVHDRGAHIAAIQDEIFGLVDEIINAKTERDAWTKLESVVAGHLKVTFADIVTLPGGPRFKTRGSTSGNRVELAIARFIDGETKTQVLSIAAETSNGISSSVEDAVFTLHPAVQNIFKIRDLHIELIRGAENTAIAHMTQMLAHDVRKPFSLLRMGLGMLGRAKDPDSIKRVLRVIVPEIEKALSSVDGLIADVMEVGSKSQDLITEPVTAESLVESAIGEIFRVLPKADVTISYEFQHIHQIKVHPQKVGRALSNIIGNAVQAMNFKGHVWIKTREVGSMVEFCLGNNGSMISPEHLEKLFDAFFTSGKKSGTGLGLTIAKKVVNAHGGKIWCESAKNKDHPEGFVEFFFTLPVAADQLSDFQADLPKYSSDIYKTLEKVTSAGDYDSIQSDEFSLEDDVVQAAATMGRTLRVLVVDDEPVYRNALVSFLTRTDELAKAISVSSAACAADALSAAANPFDLVITDIDMGPSSLDGFDFVHELRSQGLQGLICIHSNRICATDHQMAFSAGADAFLPKPIVRAQLLRLVLQAAEKCRLPIVSKASGIAAAKPHGPKAKLEVLVVDDNPFILDRWVDALSAQAKVYVMTSFEELKIKVSGDSNFLGRLNYVVTDMQLDGSDGDGLAVGRLIKKCRPDLPVLLSSDGIFAESELTGAIDRVISKNPLGLEQLCK